MNPTLVITISVAMIGAALAIFFLLTGKNLDDGESFSLKFAATVSNPDTGTTFPSEVYFCTGDNCRYYEAIYSDWQATYDLPDFFALVGIDAGAGKVVLSELTLGWMFTFQDGTLTSCDGLGNPGVDDYDPIEEAKTMAGESSERQGRTRTRTWKYDVQRQHFSNATNASSFATRFACRSKCQVRLLQ